MPTPPFLFGFVFAALLGPAGLQAQRAPVVRIRLRRQRATVPHTDTVAGVALSDPYVWLRDDKRTRPEVLDHLRGENAYTEAMTRRTGPLQDTLYREMVGHIKETDLSVPERLGGYYYYTRTEKGKQYPIFCRKRGSLSARETILLDENALGRGHAYSRVALRQVSPDGNLLAYTHDTTGSEWYTVRVKDLRTGRLLPDAIDSVSYGLEWSADNRTLFFTRDNAAHRPDRIFRRVLGDSAETLVVSEPDSLFFLAFEQDQGSGLSPRGERQLHHRRGALSPVRPAHGRVAHLGPPAGGHRILGRAPRRRLPDSHQRRRGQFQGDAGAHGRGRSDPTGRSWFPAVTRC